MVAARKISNSKRGMMEKSEREKHGITRCEKAKYTTLYLPSFHYDFNPSQVCCIAASALLMAEEAKFARVEFAL